MSGAGNDFIVFPCAPTGFGEPVESFVRGACRAHFGVGADGVLFVTPGTARNEVVLAHYNADGGRSDFCGNGSRCAARFALLRGLATSPVALSTDVGRLRAEISGDSVRIEVPTPSRPVARALAVDGRIYEGRLLVAGVPHFVMRVSKPEEVDLSGIGPRLRNHPDLGADGANVDWLGPAEHGRYRIRTFERGVEGETLACGSGAIAAAAVLAAEGAASPVRLTPLSGIDLTVGFAAGAGGAEAFTLTGEARVIFEGTLRGRSEEAGRHE